MNVLATARVALVMAAFALAGAQPASAESSIYVVAGKAGKPGSGGGAGGSAAQLNRPTDVAVCGDAVWIADSANSAIRRVNRGGVITTGVDGATPIDETPGSTLPSRLVSPTGIGCASGNDLLIADSGSGVIFRWDSETARLKPVAGRTGTGPLGDDGSALNADLSQPTDVAQGPDGSVYIADQGHARIRRVRDGVISTMAGTGAAGFTGDGGPATLARLGSPEAIAVGLDSTVYIADPGNHRVRAVSPQGIISTVAGTYGGFGGDGGDATAAQLSGPRGVTISAAGIVVSDSGNKRLRLIGRTGQISTIAGNGTRGSSPDGAPARLANFSALAGVVAHPDGGLLVADSESSVVSVLSQERPSYAAGAGNLRLSVPAKFKNRPFAELRRLNVLLSSPATLRVLAKKGRRECSLTKALSLDAGTHSIALSKTRVRTCVKKRVNKVVIKGRTADGKYAQLQWRLPRR